MMEEVLLEVMYEIPSIENVRKCVVDENVIVNRSRVGVTGRDAWQCVRLRRGRHETM